MPSLKVVQHYLANGGITQSAVRLGPRGRGVTRMARIARSFCAKIPLERLPVATENYIATLDQWTDALKCKLPVKGRYWGTARKCLNIFMRDAFYNLYLHNEYHLERLESELEVPLDNDVAKGIIKYAKELSLPPLPRWTAIVHLDKANHAIFQQRATEIAQTCGLQRVHLDMYFWRGATLDSKLALPVHKL